MMKAIKLCPGYIQVTITVNIKHRKERQEKKEGAHRHSLALYTSLSSHPLSMLACGHGAMHVGRWMCRGAGVHMCQAGLCVCMHVDGWMG